MNGREKEISKNCLSPLILQCHAPQCQGRLTTAKLPLHRGGVGASLPKNPSFPTYNYRINGVSGPRNGAVVAAASAPTQVFAQKIQPKFRNDVRRREKRAQLFETVGNGSVDSGTTILGIRNSNGKPTSGNELLVKSSTRSLGQPSEYV